MLLNSFKLHSPKSLKEALELYSGLEGAKILAGGTFLINTLKVLKKKGLKTSKNIISLNNIDDLKGISLNKDILTIKAMSTISEIYGSDLLTDNLLSIKEACHNLGTTTIRNMATIGGNLTCRFTWTEIGTVLTALDAKLHFLGKDANEEIISTEDFFKNNAKTDKILSHISIKKEKAEKTIYKRINKRSEVDVPMLSICIKTNLKKNKFENTIVAINNGSDFVKRDYTLENFLNDAPAKEATINESLNNIDSAIYDEKSDEYKQHISRITIKNILKDLIGK